MKSTQKKAAGKNPAKLLKAQLETEWQRRAPLAGDQELTAMFVALMLPALDWVAGDPLTATFPDDPRCARLAGLCAYLRKAEGQEAQARAQMLGQLHAAWERYQLLAVAEVPNGTAPLNQELAEFTWAALEPTFNADPDAERPRLLPDFHTRESADFHLAALAVLFLNRALKRPLTDLSSTSLEKAS